MFHSIPTQYKSNFFSHSYAVLLFLGATLLILGKMLFPGYILTLDMVWTDSSLWSWSSDGFNNGAPIYIVFTALHFIFPAWIIQKLLLIGLIFGLLYFPYRFLPFLSTNISRLFAGFLYALNPFVYARLLAGQWSVLLGYMCLPFLLYCLVRLLEKRDRTSGLFFGAALILVGVCSIHFLYLSIIISLAWITVALVRGSHRQRLALVRASTWGIALLLVGSAYWLVPAIQRDTPLEQRFTVAHFADFSASENLLVSAPLNLAVLGGFWGEGEEWRFYFVWPQERGIFWCAALLLSTLVLTGVLSLFRSKETRGSAVGLVILGIAAYILALGVWGGVFSSFNLWLYENIPGWSGLRDSHKIAGVLALVYVLFASRGIEEFISYLHKKMPEWVHTCVPVLFVLPIVFGMYEFLGFHNQLIPTDYPDAWYAARTLVQQTPPEDKMLVLPWQGYFSLPFNNQLITANPATPFFGDHKVISSRTVGLEGIYDQETDANYRSLDGFLHETPTLSTSEITTVLRTKKIRYLFVIVNDMVEDQNSWLLPKYPSDEELKKITPQKNVKESSLIQELLRSPHEILIDSDILLYRFTF